jgi:hypothetical protein
MNGIAKTGLITIHVTPEKSCSYASVEVSGFQVWLQSSRRKAFAKHRSGIGVG